MESVGWCVSPTRVVDWIGPNFKKIGEARKEGVGVFGGDGDRFVSNKAIEFGLSGDIVRPSR